MWKCHKCGKPVYFAERKQSLGYDWHPECLRCEECGKRLNPGQHAEHKGVPYCHVPCYGALFGPQLFGHGTRVESHTSFGKVENRSGGPNLPRSHLESKLKVFNGFYDGRSGEIRSREVNGRLVLEGALRIHWGVIGMIHLKEDDDQRTVVTIRKRNSCRSDGLNGIEVVDEIQNVSDNEASNDVDTSKDEPETEPEELSCSETISTLSSEADLKHKSSTLPPKLDVKQIDWDELDDLLQVERKVDESEKLYQTMPGSLPSVSSQVSVEGSDHSAPCLSAQSSVDTTESPTSEDNSVRGSFSDSGVGTGNRTLRSSAHDEDGDTLDQELSNMNKYPTLDKNLNRSMSGPECLERHWDHCANDDTLKSSSLSESLKDDLDHCEEIVVLRKAAKTGSAAIRRRPGKRRSRTKLKRRCSINGHFYNRETSFFTPPHGSQMSVWVTSLVNTQEVINLLLEKYKVDSKADNFALFVVRDNGEQRRLRDDEYPLLVRVMLGPHEDVSKLFLMDRQNTQEISCEVAQFLNLSIAECRAILERYQDEEEREMKRVRLKFREMRKRIKQRMEDLKDPDKKYFKRADLVAREQEEYKEKYGSDKDTGKGDSKQDEKGKDCGDENMTTDSSDHATLPRREVIRRLRERGEPVFLFGESEVDAFRRLRRSEILEPEVNKGLRNDFQEALEKVDQAFLDEILASQVQDTEGHSSTDVKVQDDGITYDEIQKMAVNLGKGDRDLDMNVITLFIQFLLKMWGNQLNSRSAAEKMTVKGKLACATYTQTQVYLKPLIRKLKTKSVPEDIAESLTEITSFMLDRDYIKASDAYLQMAIGNAPWPIGVTMVGIHARTGREKIFSKNVAHVMNDETQRKYLQGLKRLMTKCQQYFPTDPSKCVEYTKLI